MVVVTVRECLITSGGVFLVRIRNLMLVAAMSITLVVPGTALAAGAATMSVSGNALSADRSSASSVSAQGAEAVKAGAGLRATPNYEKDVSPRVQCGGKDCGGFNGHVEWGPNYVKIWGIVWGTSGGEAAVYLKWTSSIVTFNKEAGVAPGSAGVGVNKYYGTFEPGYITVTVCSAKGSWHCGPSEDP
jgi:hypothetical protein